ncbi:hypothetical protein HPULCUR_010213 [Helicostylum pulchrum]|uniref:Uncharacterized protein n=1 Tax=Helicostylum pulchrum TaxID=562976 RepID=A0ABP9YDK3_9FUNG
MTKIIDIQVIEELYRTLKEKYVDADICISDEMQLGVTKVLRRLNSVNYRTKIDIPKSSMWLHNKVNKMKNGGLISIQDFIDSFPQELRRATKRDEGTEKAVGNKEREVLEIAEIQDIPEDDENGDDIRVVSSSLKRVINKNIAYDDLLQRLEVLQDTCISAINGLSKAAEILLNMVLSGDIIHLKENITFIDFSSIDLNNNYIGQGAEPIAVLDNTSLDYLEKTQITHFGQFWNLLSSCVSRKSSEKEKTRKYII